MRDDRFLRGAAGVEPGVPGGIKGGGTGLMARWIRVKKNRFVNTAAGIAITSLSIDYALSFCEGMAGMYEAPFPSWLALMRPPGGFPTAEFVLLAVNAALVVLSAFRGAGPRRQQMYVLAVCGLCFALVFSAGKRALLPLCP